MTTQQHPFTNHQITPEVRERLLDRDTVAAAYATNDIRAAGKLIGAGQKTFANALRYHGIRVRKRGEKPPGLQLTRSEVERAVLRAYARSDRCPPSCPGREGCLDGECILWELIG